MLNPIRIGRHSIEHPIVLAPMAGVTDQPFRAVCREFGAGYAVSEMLSSNPELWQTQKSRSRMNFSGERGLVAVQIAGSEPGELAAAARHNVDNGARIIDINMGCPAKKVCRRWAGSALLRDEDLVARILDAVVAAVDVPVTLKIRTGWHRDHVNGVAIAQIAQRAGVSMLAVHGRTRDMLYTGVAEYRTIAAIKASVTIPVLANGDVDSPEKAAFVLEQTGADGLMLGRGAQGRPWIFRQIRDFLASGTYREPDADVVRGAVLRHIGQIHSFYGEHTGVRVARKHLRWYAATIGAATDLRNAALREASARRQLELARGYFDRLEVSSDAATASIQCRTGMSVPEERCI